MRDMIDRQTPFAQIFYATAAESIFATDADAIAYIRAVNNADGQPLEKDVQTAIDTFVKGLKDDGLWTPIEASAIWGAARTLTGALVSLKGPAVTNVNFVSGDYARKTGLKGDGATTRIDTGYSNSQTNGQNDKHAAVWVTSALSAQTSKGLFGNTAATGATYARSNPTTASTLQHQISGSQINLTNGSSFTGFFGLSRASSANFVRRWSGSDTTINSSSSSQTATSLHVHSVGTASSGDSRIFFYSFGRALTLSSLESRVSTLRTAIAAAIP